MLLRLPAAARGALPRWGCMALAAASANCGAKTDLKDPIDHGQLSRGKSSPFATVGDACNAASDCRAEDRCQPLRCVANACAEAPAIVCDDGDACTDDRCLPETGVCEHEHVSQDRDEDGHYAPLPGYQPGDPQACGDDCDDRSAEAHPGGTELCDGVDNDCNGAVDDGFQYVPSGRAATLLSNGEQAGLGGITHSGDLFIVSLSDFQGHQQNQLAGVDDAGRVVFSEELALTNSDTFAGPVVFDGRALASAWEDRRDRDYEIYFNRFDAAGNKLDADLRITNASGFSLNPTLRFTGTDYFIAWGDKRDGAFHIYGDRVDERGQLLSGGANVNLTPELPGTDSPGVALGSNNFGLVFASENDGKRIGFRTVSLDLQSTGTLTILSDAGGTGAGVKFNQERYLVTWGERGEDDTPGPAILGAVLDSAGTLLRAGEAITEPAQFARSHSLLVLGDRLLLFWSQWVDDSYDIFFRWLGPDLAPLSDAERVTVTPGNAVGPAPAFGDDGTIGVAYTDFSEGAPQVYFTSLLCQ